MNNNAVTKKNISGLVLAGGQARRMGGIDKGLIDIHGQTIVERITRILKQQCNCVMINANRNREIYRQFGDKVIKDEIDGFQGPLAGMLSGLNAIRTEWLLTAPCDGPFLSNTYAESMLHAAQSIGVSIAVAKDQNRLQPVYALLHSSTRDSLQAFLNTGERKIDKWFAEFNFAEVVITDCDDMFENINTPEQLEICREKLASNQSKNETCFRQIQS